MLEQDTKHKKVNMKNFLLNFCVLYDIIYINLKVDFGGLSINSQYVLE